MCARRGISVHELSSLEYLAASGTAGVATAICTNPIWVVKTRMLSTGKSAAGSYRGLAGAPSHKIIKNRWSKADSAKRGDPRILFWLDPISHWCVSWCCPIHVLREDEKLALTAEARVRQS